MVYNQISFNSEFIASFTRQADWLKYADNNKHWGLTREQLKELHTLCKLKHKKEVPLAGDDSGNAEDI